MERKRKNGSGDLTQQAQDLRVELQGVIDDRDGLIDRVRHILNEYDQFSARVEQVVEEAQTPPEPEPEPEDEFANAVKGLKGTGVQKNSGVMLLRQIRKTRGLTLRNLADAIGVPYPHLSEIERGLRFPLEDERQAIEAWAGGQLNFRCVPFVLIGPVKGE